MAPWLITTFGWPGLTAHVAGVTARLLVDPPLVVGGSMGVLACAGAALLGSRMVLRRRASSG